MPAFGKARFWDLYVAFARASSPSSSAFVTGVPSTTATASAGTLCVVAPAGGCDEHGEGDEDGEDDAGGLHVKEALL